MQSCTCLGQEIATCFCAEDSIFCACSGRPYASFGEEYVVPIQVRVVSVTLAVAGPCMQKRQQVPLLSTVLLCSAAMTAVYSGTTLNCPPALEGLLGNLH